MTEKRKLAYCSVPDCKNTAQNSPGLSFHRYPPEYSDEWVEAVSPMKGWRPTLRALVCGKHFSKSSILKRAKRTLLKKGAIPTRFLPKPQEGLLYRYVGPKRPGKNRNGMLAKPREFEYLEVVPKIASHWKVNASLSADTSPEFELVLLPQNEELDVDLANVAKRSNMVLKVRDGNLDVDSYVENVDDGARPASQGLEDDSVTKSGNGIFWAATLASKTGHLGVARLYHVSSSSVEHPSEKLPEKPANCSDKDMLSHNEANITPVEGAASSCLEKQELQVPLNAGLSEQGSTDLCEIAIFPHTGHSQLPQVDMANEAAKPECKRLEIESNMSADMKGNEHLNEGLSFTTTKPTSKTGQVGVEGDKLDANLAKFGAIYKASDDNLSNCASKKDDFVDSASEPSSQRLENNTESSRKLTTSTENNQVSSTIKESTNNHELKNGARVHSMQVTCDMSKFKIHLPKNTKINEPLPVVKIPYETLLEKLKRGELKIVENGDGITVPPKSINTQEECPTVANEGTRLHENYVDMFHTYSLKAAATAATAAANIAQVDNILNGVNTEPEQAQVESCENYPDAPTTSTDDEALAKLDETTNCPTYNASYIDLPDVSDGEEYSIDAADPAPAEDAADENNIEQHRIPFMALSVNPNSNFTIKSTSDKTIPLLIINLYDLCDRPEEYAKLFERAITIDIPPVARDDVKLNMRKTPKSNKENKEPAPLRGQCLLQFDLAKNKPVVTPSPVERKKAPTKIAKMEHLKIPPCPETVVKPVVVKPPPVKKEEKLTVKRPRAPPPVEVVLPKRIKSAPLSVIDQPNLLDPNITDPFADIPQFPSLNIAEPIEIKQEIDGAGINIIELNDSEIHPSCIKSEPLIDIPAGESVVPGSNFIILNHIINSPLRLSSINDDRLLVKPIAETSTTNKILPAAAPGISNDTKHYFKVKTKGGVKLMCSVCRSVGNPVDHLKSCTIKYKY